MLKFIVSVKMENGDVWETVRHTTEDLSEVMSCLWKDDKVISFSVTEKKHA